MLAHPVLALCCLSICLKKATHLSARQMVLAEAQALSVFLLVSTAHLPVHMNPAFLNLQNRSRINVHKGQRHIHETTVPVSAMLYPQAWPLKLCFCLICFISQDGDTRDLPWGGGAYTCDTVLSAWGAVRWCTAALQNRPFAGLELGTPGPALPSFPSPRPWEPLFSCFCSGNVTLSDPSGTETKRLVPLCLAFFTKHNAI